MYLLEGAGGGGAGGCLPHFVTEGDVEVSPVHVPRALEEEGPSAAPMSCGSFSSQRRQCLKLFAAVVQRLHWQPLNRQQVPQGPVRCTACLRPLFPFRCARAHSTRPWGEGGVPGAQRDTRGGGSSGTKRCAPTAPTSPAFGARPAQTAADCRWRTACRRRPVHRTPRAIHSLRLLSSCGTADHPLPPSLS